MSEAKDRKSAYQKAVPLVAPWGCERLVPGATHHYELQANWKIAIENYHECYHCPLIHPELCRVSPSDVG